MRGDRLVHQRLGESRLVAFVMAVTAIAEDVDDHVFLEAMTEFRRDARDMHHGFGIVAVDVEDRRLNLFRDLGAIRTAARVGGAGGEADLVVDDEMNRAAGAIALELGEIEQFGNQALAGESRIAMHQEADDLISLGVLALLLLGADLAEDDRVDRFEMRGIRLQRKMDEIAVEAAVARRAEMVFDVARALHVLGIDGIALEFREHGGERLAHHVGEHVQAAAMRHADHQLFHAELAAALDHLLERRDQRFAAIEAEALGAGVALVAEFLEHLGIGQALQDRALAHHREFGVVARHLDTRLDPLALLELLDVHVFDADLVRIRRLERRQDLLQGRDFEAEEIVDEDRPVEIGLGEAVGRRIEVGMISRALQPERIEIGDQMAPRAIGADQVHRAQGVERRLLRIGGQLDRRRGVTVGQPHGRGMAVDDLQRRRTAPARTRDLLLDAVGLVLELREELPPALIDAGRVFEVTRVEFGDVIGVVAGQEAALLALGHDHWGMRGRAKDWDSRPQLLARKCYLFG